MITSTYALNSNGLRPFSIRSKGFFGWIKSGIKKCVD